MASVDNWCKLTYEFELSSVKRIYYPNNYGAGYEIYKGLPLFNGHYTFDGRIGVVVKFAKDKEAEKSHQNPNFNLIIHCLLVEKETLKLLKPDKCLRVKITSYVYENCNNIPKINHMFEQLSFRMSSISKSIEFESFTNAEFLSKFANSKLVVELQIVCIKGVDPSTRRPMDLEKLISDLYPADIELVVDGQLFKAHKSVLGYRCDYFKLMFNSKMKEQRENRVEIKDVDKDVFSLFLKYIYTGKISEELKEKFNLEKFLILADRFQVDDLKSYLADLMIDQLTVDNAVECLTLAKTISHQELKTAALDFICRNKNQI